MCGRFTLRTPAAAWTQAFLPLWTEEEIVQFATEHAIAARYNIAPTQMISCVRAGEESHSERRQWSLFRWGLIPSWARELAIGNRMINARSETAHEKRSFKSAFHKRRCLIPADGYYEWMKTPGGKQPYLIGRTDGKMLAMAGLWESNSRLGEDDDRLLSCTILTTAANGSAKKIHDRMPVFLDEDNWQAWLDPAVNETETVKSLIRPTPEDLLIATPVSTTVNSPRNDTPECVQPIEEESQPSLFD